MGFIKALKTVAKTTSKIAFKGVVAGGSYVAGTATSYVSMKFMKWGAISLLLLAL